METLVTVHSIFVIWTYLVHQTIILLIIFVSIFLHRLVNFCVCTTLNNNIFAWKLSIALQLNECNYLFQYAKKLSLIYLMLLYTSLLFYSITGQPPLSGSVLAPYSCVFFTLTGVSHAINLKKTLSYPPLLLKTLYQMITLSTKARLGILLAHEAHWSASKRLLKFIP